MTKHHLICQIMRYDIESNNSGLIKLWKWSSASFNTSFCAVLNLLQSRSSVGQILPLKFVSAPVVAKLMFLWTDKWLELCSWHPFRYSWKVVLRIYFSVWYVVCQPLLFSLLVSVQPCLPLLFRMLTRVQSCSPLFFSLSFYLICSSSRSRSELFSNAMLYACRFSPILLPGSFFSGY